MRNLFCYVSILLFSINLYALESVDVLKTRILKAYDKNILVLNRGLEDAIFKADHIKLTSRDGFIARAICIKASMQTSHWKVYRVVRPNLVSKDKIYDLVSILQSEIPKSLLKFANINFEKYLNNYGVIDEKKLIKLQQKRIAKYDLPANVNQSREYNQKSLTGFDKLIEENFSDKEFSKDISRSFVEMYVDPMTIQTREDKSESVFGAAIYNFGLKYQYSIKLDEQQIKYPQFTERRTRYDVEFAIKRFTENTSLVSRFEYYSYFSNGIAYPLRRQTYGPLGFRYHFWENNQRTDFMDITYVPSYDFLEFSNQMAGSDNRNNDIIEGIRHIFMLRANTMLTDKIRWENRIIIRPFSSLTLKANQTNDSQPFINSKVSYQFNKNLSIGYDLLYESDENFAKVYGLSSENIVSNLQLKYSFQL